ncbi:hypothetical protein [Arthrobacter sp. H35-D1]|uniref:hypothetical protein n=1 Tax=Arthrobacter sp. H35-D1 TaxID=3046202 RepID=UPI0024BB8BC5|nr:hypothetical protein [Arthrobacter sp. H35-D1]MDJ0315439.1 hypothetical protein [Arthrobacter sp. H35-D1]
MHQQYFTPAPPRLALAPPFSLSRLLPVYFLPANAPAGRRPEPAAPLAFVEGDEHVEFAG